MTQLDGYRLANKAERRQHRAEVVFFRSAGKRTYKIYGARCQESWEQWGAPTEILCDNVPTIENWHRTLIEA